jgi:acetoin utilization deacetylase AcuC-like enzyme
LTKLYYCDFHEIPLPAGHRFPVTKYRLVRELLEPDGLFDFTRSPIASIEDVELAHDPEYVRQFMQGELPAAAIRRIGFPWSEGLVRRTLASVGGTLQATRDAVETGCGATLAGGTHHAFRAEGSGFCVFNDIAIAIEWLRAEHGVKRAAVIDLDVHQGDGTAAIFAADPGVFTLSIHGRNNFPFRKQQSRLDVDLADGTGDEEYLKALDSVLPRVFEFDPQAVFYQSGVDALESDTLGRLALTPEGLRERDMRVMTAAKAHGAPFILTLGGGYSKPIELTAQAHATTYRTAAQFW